MRLETMPQSVTEWLALRANRVPLPLAHTQISFVLARAVLAAFRFDLFELSRDRAVTIEELAVIAELDARALASLMHVLTVLGYFRYARGRYALTALARKWCLRDSASSVCDQQRFNLVSWRWMDHMDEFLQTGRGLRFHDRFGPRDWGDYQRGMADVARISVAESVRMMPSPPSPRQMLDIGGAHGLYSVAMCKRHHALQATILDLPQAVKHSGRNPLRFGLGHRIRYRSGNALKAALGEEEYDVILVSSLIHHFTAEQAQRLAQRIARALRPGGWLVIQEFLRPLPGEHIDMAGSALDLFFNLSSTSGSWSLPQLRGFLDQAGLNSIKVNRFLAPPGYAQVCGRKSG